MSIGTIALLLVGMVAGSIWWANEQFERIPTFEEVGARDDVDGEQLDSVVLGPVYDGDDESAAGIEAESPADAEPIEGDEAVDGGDEEGDGLAPATTEPPRSTAAGNVFLAFSLGSSGVDAEEAGRAAIPSERAGMADGLTDSIMVVAYSTDAERVAVVSIPRDLWVDRWGTRINALYNLVGVDALTEEVEWSTGLDIDHRIAVNFSAFADVVDAVGGVPVAFDHPVRDRATGLHVYEPACRVLSGSEALALARSRKLESQGTDGYWRRDPSASDFGRMARQQVIVAATIDELLSPSLVTRVPDLFEVARDNLIVDEELSLSTVMGAGWDAVGGVDVRFFSLPATVGWEGAASVVHADEDAAATMRADIDAFLSGDAPTPTTSTTAAPTPSGDAGDSVTSTTLAPTTSMPTSTSTAPESGSVAAPNLDSTGGISPCG
ncbi:MAG: LCP family protein [Actinomycetota bacterium]|nr:LCP family protein [Actinomycetota bacterium]